MNFKQSAKTLYAAVSANPRLRWGLLGIVAVLWFYGILELRDQVQRKNEAHGILSKKTARIQGSAAQAEWPSRLKEAQSLQLALENRLWREGTIGLAQATINDWLTLITQQASLGKVQLGVAAQEDDVRAGKSSTGSDNGAAPPASDLWKVSARLAFDFNPQSFYALLNRISTNEKKVAVESLVIRSAPTPKAELLLVAYFIKPAAGVPAAVKAQNAAN
jgi:hypothetical protein